MRSISVLFLFLISVIFIDACSLASMAYAQQKIPCVERNHKGRWKMQDSFCIQYTVKEYKEVVDRLKQLEHYKFHVEPACLIEKKERTRLTESFLSSSNSWKNQEASYLTLIGLAKKGEAEWRDQFYKLKKMKAPEKSWTEHPALWFTIGITTAILIAVGTAYIYNAFKPATTTASPLRVPSPMFQVRGSVFVRQSRSSPTFLLRAN